MSGTGSETRVCSSDERVATRLFAGRNCPKDFDVAIERGGLVLFGQPFLISGISGPGYLRVLYIVSCPPLPRPLHMSAPALDQ